MRQMESVSAVKTEEPSPNQTHCDEAPAGLTRLCVEPGKRGGSSAQAPHSKRRKVYIFFV